MDIRRAMLLAFAFLVVTATSTVAWGDSDRVLLKDISVLTLHHGRMTNSRRTSPIPQLKCVGGSAGCNSFNPKVVQCYNRGSDGYDIQWECKTDMDNAYRFGQVEVSCEGYDYPDDIYVLKGSCGLEYTLDLTKEGMAQQSHGHDYYGSSHDNSHHGSSYTKSNKRSGSSLFGDAVTLCIVGVIIYAIYKTCLSNAGHEGNTADGGRHDSYRGNRPNPSAPPPPGFRDEYMPRGGCSSTYDSSSHGSYTSPGTGSTGGGFWTGAATGGMLGYLFGSRNNTNYGYQRPYGGSTWGSGWGSGWGSSGHSYRSGGSWGSGSGSTFRPSTASTGTRTASGFGGTKRR